MPRGSKNQSIVFKAVLDSAKKQLHLTSNEAAAFKHSGIRGDERAAALAKFLREHLPKSYGVAKGEAIDYCDQRTGQLDVLIYDADMAAPISAQSENVLIPAESLLAVIEVKTTLSQAELDGCYTSASKVRKLKPFKRPFIAPRDGRAAEDGNYRCLYIVFAYETNLAQDNWLQKEFERIHCATEKHRFDLSLIDIVFVLDRGMIRPTSHTGKTNDGEAKDTFLEFYLHIVNFLRREQPRRPLMDWQAYTTKTAKGWSTLSIPTTKNSSTLYKVAFPSNPAFNTKRKKLK